MTTPTVSAPRRVAFWSLRGGAGRTMALANVAAVLTHQGARVAVRDENPEGTLHRYLGLERADVARGLIIDPRAAARVAPDFELVNLPPGSRPNFNGCAAVVPVLTPGVLSPSEVADALYAALPAHEVKVVPLLSRCLHKGEEELGRGWGRNVARAFARAGMRRDHFHRCAVPQHIYWGFFHEACPLAVALDGFRDVPGHPTEGYHRLAEALIEALR